MHRFPRLTWLSPLALASLTLLAACDEDLPAEPAYCTSGSDWSAPELDPALQEGAPALVVGEGTGSEFFAWDDGEQVALISGPQGGTMLMPTFRLESAALDMGSEPDCLHVRVYRPGGEWTQVNESFEFAATDGSIEAGPFWLMNDAGPIELTVVVTAHERWQATTTFRVDGI